MIDSHMIYLLSAAVVAVVGLILLIAVVKLNPLITLLVTSVALGLATGMAPHEVMHAFEQGVGATLGHIAIVVALGTMLGKMMAESGGAEQIAQTLIRIFGEKRIHWAMVLIGIIVGLPSFFEVGFVLLIPIVFTVARRTGTSLILIALPMLAGLSIVHGLVPPHPAAMMTVVAYNADIGRTILYALIVGVPAAILAGPVYAKILAPHMKIANRNPLAEELNEHETKLKERETKRQLPGFGLTLLTILMPVLLMLLGSSADAVSQKGSALNEWLHLIGNDDLALLAGVLFSFITLGRMRGFSRATILRFSQECLAPTATITLLVGAGGGFGRILAECGVSDAVIAVAMQSHLPILLLAWMLAAMMRLATGSSTVAMSTAAGIVAPLVLHGTATVRPELLVIATGAGSLIFSHVNDGGFWLVKEYLGLSVAETLKSWSVTETILSVVGLLGALGLSIIL
jgi:gluconate:H+ symporter, GntP family